MNKEYITETLTSKDDSSAWELAEKIIAESADESKWYEYLDVFAELMDHPKSYVRNRAMLILAAVSKWDDKGRFDAIMPVLFAHITDKKPITSRQCIKALAQIGREKPQYIPMILSSFGNADLSGYKESMASLIRKDIEEAENLLRNI